MVIKRYRILHHVKLNIEPATCFAMLATLSRFEKHNREHIASGYLKALSSVAADDELTQILTAAEDLELDGDGAEWHRYLVKRINGVLETIASQGTIEQDIAPIQNPTVVGNWRR